MPNPEHRATIRHATKATNELRQLFNQALGSHAAPRGKIFRAYNAARRELDGNTGNPVVVNQAMQELRSVVSTVVRESLTEAQTIGSTQVLADLRTYGYAAANPTATATGDALAIILSPLEAQIRAARSGVYSQASLLGDEGRAGLLTPAAVNVAAADWLTRAAVDIWGMAINTTVGAGNNEFLKQVIAGIDERTTRTCLRAHGQTRPLNEDFHLTEEPRYADYLPNPPFHNYCRSVMALVRNLYANDELTQDMKRAAELEREARERADYVAPHPANALTRVRR